MLMALMLVRGLVCSRATLLAENALLRHQIAVLQRSVRRPKFAGRDRLLWVLVSLVWRRWRECLIVVQPATVVASHRAGFRAYWRWKCRGGRPAIRRDLRGLILRIAAENPLWGVPRIQAELAILGHRLARATIAKYLGVRPTRSPTWRAFVRTHMASTVAMDFFTVPTLTGRVLYVFMLLHHARRRIVHFNVTATPSAAWVVRQLKDAFPFDSGPRFLIHDNDGMFGEAVSSCPGQHGHHGDPDVAGLAVAECVRRAVHRDASTGVPHHVIALHERHAWRVIEDYLVYDHEARCHQGLGRDSPEGRSPEAAGCGSIISKAMAGGLQYRYRRVA